MASPLRVFQDKKRRGERIAMISLYDAPTATLCCDAGADALLVGDSMGNVVLGYDNTIPVTMEDMVRHTGAVARGVEYSSRRDVPVIADLPFGSYLGSPDSVARNGTMLMQAGAHGVKIEGAGARVLEAAAVLVQMGAPVMGHIGFTPQSLLALTGVVQGKTANAATELLEDAQRLQEAGCFAIVLEAMPSEVAARITRSLKIPTIGIGAGSHCSGQVLVWHDLAGIKPDTPLRFVKRYADVHALLARAARDYIGEVRSGAFPTSEHEWAMAEEELVEWQNERVEPERDIRDQR